MSDDNVLVLCRADLAPRFFEERGLSFVLHLPEAIDGSLGCNPMPLHDGVRFALRDLGA